MLIYTLLSIDKSAILAIFTASKHCLDTTKI
uniref:Uncharacterized protein n=1 Tax=Myoviridae sp. ct9MV2 TaxID=2826625 RepID=A0A8S5NCX9_9CAUD|nr:MAG TPA: hypothetical protein [Myoviridae sp. ct9MV2]